MSIPKTIHYCWFGGKEKPELARRCIASWNRYCPDYRLVEWNESNFDLSNVPLYVRQALDTGRWAFVTDYVRLKVLIDEGGVYMDTDVELVKSLDPYLHHKAFAGFESMEGLQTGLMGCEKGFALFEEFLAHYYQVSFLKEDGSMDTTTNVPVFTALCQKYGLVMNDRFQIVADMAVYPREIFCPIDFNTKKLKRTRHTVSIHWFSGSWHTKEDLDIIHQERLRQQREKASERRVKIGTALLGETGYRKVKSVLKQER